MKRLCLLRHAKSSLARPGEVDLERPLAPRGRRDTVALASWMRERGIRPQLVLCSPARRTRETLELVRGGIGDAPVTLDPVLYHASSEGLLRVVADVPDDVSDLLLIGHNPGLHDLVCDLAGPGPLRARIEAKLPTGALVVLESTVERWAALPGRTAALVDLALPRELPGAARHDQPGGTR